MSVYAIGDVQGCYDSLARLTDKLRFDPASDRLWFVGDLVNRGPKSLQVLRFVRSLGEGAVAVLGNHDLHLLATAFGRRNKQKDTLDDILYAPDRDDLIHWLLHRPLLHRDAEMGVAMFHAGLPPQWTVDEALLRAREVEAVLQGPDAPLWFQRMYGDRPDHWGEDLKGWERLRFIVNCLTRLRYCTADGRLGLDFKGPPGSQPQRFMPWFEVPGRKSIDHTLVFGHWSTLGYKRHENVVGLDTGCLWGGSLTAFKVDDGGGVIDIACPKSAA